MHLQLLELRGPDEFERVFAAMSKERVGALLVVADAVFVLHRSWLAGLAVTNQLPSMHGIRENVEAGGLIHYRHNSREQFRQVATFVDKIFKGAVPSRLPVQQPTKFELVIILKTAKALGLAYRRFSSRAPTR